jgi:site-specific DNA-methyltransferase (adenine-specific)/adenine-specific DNA-methyltransferase
LGIYSINCPSGRVIEGPPKGSYWRVSKAKFDELDKDGRIWWGKEGNNVPAPKIFLSEVKQGIVPMTIWTYEEAGHTQDAKKELIEVLPEALEVFTTPKPPKLIERIIQLTAGANDIVLDSFAGSGTTGHAVLKLNKQDGGNRRFILVEMDDNIARNVTAERVRRVAQGYTNGKDQAVEGLGGSFQFCTLSKEPLFTAEGQIRSDVTFAQLAEFVWFVETGTGLQASHSLPFKGRAGEGMGVNAPSKSTHPHPNCPLASLSPSEGEGVVPLSPMLGTHEGRAIYLLYNGILKDKSVAGGNVLTGAVYDILPPHDGPKVIFAAASRLGATRLAREQIVFKQTPYALGV